MPVVISWQQCCLTQCASKHYAAATVPFVPGVAVDGTRMASPQGLILPSFSQRETDTLTVHGSSSCVCASIIIYVYFSSFGTNGAVTKTGRHEKMRFLLSSSVNRRMHLGQGLIAINHGWTQRMAVGVWDSFDRADGHGKEHTVPYQFPYWAM